MKAPRCKICGTEHRLGPCPDTMTKRERDPFVDAFFDSVVGEKKRMAKAKAKKPAKKGKRRQPAKPKPRKPMPPGGLHPRVGRPRPENRDSTLAAVQPWLDLEPPVSRATYFRRKKRAGPGANAWEYTPRKKAVQ